MGISESLDNSDVPAEHMHRRVYVCVRVWMLIARVKFWWRELSTDECWPGLCFKLYAVSKRTVYLLTC